MKGEGSQRNEHFFHLILFVLDLRAKPSVWYKQCLRLAAAPGGLAGQGAGAGFLTGQKRKFGGRENRTVCVSFLLKSSLKKPDKLF